MADWLSIRRRVGEAGGRTRSSASSIRSQVRYFTASARATYSASQLLWAMIVCVDERANTYVRPSMTV
eukprot:6510852-Prorocentrum_lima.AAC.2